MAAGLRLPWKSKREKALEHRKLRQEQDLLHSLSQASVAYFIAVKPDYKIYYLNPAALKALGYHSQELIGQDYLTTIVLEDDIEKARQGLEDGINSKQAYIASYRILTKAGEPLEIEWRNRPVLKVNGALDYVLNIGVDVTERRKAEEALSLSERRFRTMFEQSLESLMIISPEGNPLLVNQAYTKMWGLKLENIEGYNIFRDKQLQNLGVMPYIEAGFRGEPSALPPIPYSVEGVADLPPDKRGARWTRALFYPIKDEDGTLREVVLANEDITEQKAAEEQLREREEQYRSIFEHTRDGLVISDLETGEVVEANQACCEMHGFTREEFIGLYPPAFVHPDSFELLKEYFEVIRTGKDYRCKAQDMRKDGTAFHIEVFGTSFIYKGKPHALAVLRDITEQVQAYQLLEQRVAERTRELATLLEVSGNLTSTLQLKPLLNQILDQLKEVVDYSGAAIAVVENDELVTLESRRQAEQAHLAPPNLRFPLGQSMHMLQLINSREPVMIGDVRGDDPLAEAYIKFAGEQYETLFKFVRSWLGIPLVLQGRVIGVLSLHHNEPGFYNSHLANLAMAFGSQAAIAIENARLYEQAQERTRELSTLLEISRNLTSTLQLEPLLSLILDQLKKIVDYSGSSIVDIEEGRFVIREGRRPGPPTDVALSALNFPVSSDNPILVTVLDHQQVMIEDIRDDSAFARGFREFAGPYFDTIFSHVRSWLASPLESKGNVTGMLVVTKDEPNYFTAQHAALAWAVANQASIAIENARLYEQALNLAALEERQRLARELHDSVSQALFGISLGTNSTRILLERDPSRVSQSLDYIHSLAQAGMAEMRALLFELRPESLELEGLVAALSKQAAAINARYGIKVQTDFSPEPAIPLASKEALYRIGQEAMHNIVKHAQATRIDLRLEASDDRLVLEISDNGVGFDTQASFPGHLGLRSMKERALKLGGNLQLESVPGQGTHIRVQVPVAVPV